MRQHEGNTTPARAATVSTARSNRVSRTSIHDGAKARTLHFTVLTMVLAAGAAACTFLVGARAGAALNGHASSTTIAGMRMPVVKAAAALPR